MFYKLYQERKLLTSLGYFDSVDNLEDWEVNVFSIIEDENARLMDKERKKQELLHTGK